jgi:hypothetical protein
MWNSNIEIKTVELIRDIMRWMLFKLPFHTGDITCLKRKSKKQLLKVSSHFLPAEIEHFSIREYSKCAIQSRETEVSGLRRWPGATIFFHRELPTPLSEPWRGKYPIWYTDSTA